MALISSLKTCFGYGYMLIHLKDLVKTPTEGSWRWRRSYSGDDVSADDRSNAILISGSKTDRIKLRLLNPLKLDKQSSARPLNSKYSGCLSELFESRRFGAYSCRHCPGKFQWQCGYYYWNNNPDPHWIALIRHPIWRNGNSLTKPE